MPDEKETISRREAIKSIGVGASVIAALPVITGRASVLDDEAHAHHHRASEVSDDQPKPLRFFTEAENLAVLELSERIIPADEHSAGAKAARVNEYIDLIVSMSSEISKQTWREGLATINKMSRDMFSSDFAAAGVENQVRLLTAISKNERSPQTVEERFFKTAKNAIVDGYYTSKIGIHDELHYKGNSYLKEFTGCTHPEHQQ